MAAEKPLFTETVPPKDNTTPFENIEIFERWKIWVTAECRKRFNGRGEFVADKLAEIFLERNKLAYPTKKYFAKLIMEADRAVHHKVKPRETVSIEDHGHTWDTINYSSFSEDEINRHIDRSDRIKQIGRLYGANTSKMIELLICKYTISEIAGIMKTPKRQVARILCDIAANYDHGVSI